MRSLLIVTFFVLVAVPAFARDSAVQITRQGPSLILVQKDVGDDRWAINLSLEPTSALELTGNVFRASGGPAVFLQCRPVDVLNNDAPIEQRSVVYNCFSAGTCQATANGPCDAAGWSFLAEVSLPMTFFLP